MATSRPRSFFWYDYETFGNQPRKDRPAQFAGQRTAPDLEPIGEPVQAYCAPSRDYLPKPQACLIHGITPQRAAERGTTPTEFARRIHAEVSVSGTCTAGFNANRFDHEVTRFLFYRTLRPPYKWHYENGNSKWDIIDLARAAYALRPEGIEWPTDSEGVPSFKLEDLAPANDIAHDAHDAVADVNATIDFARLLRDQQPDLFRHALDLRDKHFVRTHIDLGTMEPFVHVSMRYPAETGCTTLVAPLARHPNYSNQIVVYDLRHDPSHALSLTTEELRELLFTPKNDLPNGIARPALKRLRVNMAPFVAPARIIDETVARRISLNRSDCKKHLDLLRRDDDFGQRAAAVYDRTFEEAKRDVDCALYDSFIENRDRRTLNNILQMQPEQVVSYQPTFDDDRLPELFRRYVARNYGERLSDDQQDTWRRHCRSKLCDSPDENPPPLQAFRQQVTDLLEDTAAAQDREILHALEDYADDLQAWLDDM